MTNATKVYYIFLIYLVSAYGWGDFNGIPKEYINRFQFNGNPNYITESEYFRNPPNNFQYHQPYPFRNIPGDIEYNNNLQQQYIQPILRQLQELLQHVKSLTETRYQPVYIPFPVGSYPNTETKKSSGDSGGTLDIAHRFPDDQEDPNLNWGIVKDDEISNGTKGECNCEKTNDMARTSTMAEYMNSIDPRTRCKAATLSCCIPGYNKQQRKDCFAAQQCLKSYETGFACLPIIINAVYVELYG